MKKITLALVAVSMMAVSSFAGTWKTGKIGFIQSTDQGVKVQLVNGSQKTEIFFSSTSQFFKENLAVALTAKASNSDVAMYQDGTLWTKIKVQ